MDVIAEWVKGLSDIDRKTELVRLQAAYHDREHSLHTALASQPELIEQFLQKKADVDAAGSNARAAEKARGEAHDVQMQLELLPKLVTDLAQQRAERHLAYLQRVWELAQQEGAQDIVEAALSTAQREYGALIRLDSRYGWGDAMKRYVRLMVAQVESAQGGGA